MKKLFLALALSAAACLAGCSDNEEIGYDIGSKVLIPKNGLQQVALTADAAAIDYEVWIYRSGYNEGGSTAALSVDAEALAAYNKAKFDTSYDAGQYNKANGTAYVLMPEACYDLPTAAVRLDNNAHTAKIGIRIDVSAITADSRCVLPVSVGSPDTEVNAAAATVLIFPVRPTTEKPENDQ